MAVFVASVVLWGVTFLLGFTRQAAPVGWTELFWAVSFLPLQAVGLVVLRARRTDMVGRALIWSPFLIALGIALFSVAEANFRLGANGLTMAPAAWPATEAAFFLGESVFVIGNGGLVLGLFRFPDGRSLGGIWRLGERLLVGTLTLAVPGTLLRPSLEERLGGQSLEIANPFVGSSAEGLVWLYDVAGLLFFLAAILAMGSVLARYRRGTITTRLQLRWVLYPILVGGMLLGLIGLADAALGTDLGRDNGPATVAVSIVFTTGIPAGIVMAITRARLYEIDRVISRTVSYFLLIGALVSVYALGVLGVGTLLPDDSDLFVAGSTLAVAALFQPLRSRIQTAVDRRFNRAGYDAEQTVAAFASRLRDQIDAQALTRDLSAVATATFSPRVVTTWTAGGEPA